MDRKIQEDFTLAWKPLGIMFGVAVTLSLGTLLVVGISSHDLKTSLMAVGLLLVLPLLYRFARRQSLTDQAARAKNWLQTDTGLQCTYGEPPETETIRWEQIRQIRWVRTGGLLIFWEESGPRGPQFRDEFREGDIAGTYRTVLRVPEKEADVLAAAWQKYRKTQAAQTLPAAALQPTATTASPEHQSVEPDPEIYRFRPKHHHRPAAPKLNRQLQFTIRLGSIMGLFFIAWAALNIFQELPSGSWPVVQGKIIATDFDEIPWDGHHSQKGRVSLMYKYTVAGQTHLERQYSVRHLDFEGVLDTAHAFASAHLTGSTIDIHYDPQDPSKAVVKAGVDWGDDSAFLVLGAFFLCITLFVRVAVLRQATHPRRAESNWLMKEYGDR